MYWTTHGLQPATEWVQWTSDPVRRPVATLRSPVLQCRTQSRATVTASNGTSVVIHNWSRQRHFIIGQVHSPIIRLWIVSQSVHNSQLRSRRSALQICRDVRPGHLVWGKASFHLSSRLRSAWRMLEGQGLTSVYTVPDYHCTEPHLLNRGQARLIRRGRANCSFGGTADWLLDRTPDFYGHSVQIN